MKLVHTQSNLAQNKLSKSYRKHLEVKERLTKYEKDEDFGVIPKKFKSLGKLKRIDLGASQTFGYGRSRFTEN